MNAEHAAAELWNAYCAATEHSGAVPEIDQFGDDPKMGDELLALVLADIKRATCCLARDFTPDTLPKVGDHWIITDGQGIPACIIRTTQVTLTPIRDIDAGFAFMEGEGDRSLAYWKREHDAYFTRQGEREGFVYDDSMMGVPEHFERVWPV